jgi:hypothetical protein
VHTWQSFLGHLLPPLILDPSGGLCLQRIINSDIEDIVLCGIFRFKLIKNLQNLFRLAFKQLFINFGSFRVRADPRLNIKTNYSSNFYSIINNKECVEGNLNAIYFLFKFTFILYCFIIQMTAESDDVNATLTVS